jgi:NTE family protein
MRMATNKGFRGLSNGSISLANKRVVLLLQGGGALGAYQVGAYKALAEACKEMGSRIDWVGGISIGAINAAVIAGPRCGDAVEELDKLWNDILSPDYPPYDYTGLWQFDSSFFPKVWLERLEPKYLDWMCAAYNPFGQRNFFTSRVMNPLLNPWYLQWSRPLAPNELAFYSTEPLRDTLDRHVDWEKIDRWDSTTPKGMRLSLGATRVIDGEVVFFNSFDSVKPREVWPGRQKIVSNHVMASGALPPAFPPVQVGEDWYWDGGVSSNTPIEELREDLTDYTEKEEAKHTIVFLIDLWDRKGPIPRSLDEVVWRQKSIQYGSRKKAAETVVTMHQLSTAQQTQPTHLEVCQVMYELPPGDKNPQFAFSDADFSRTTFEKMRGLGYTDMKTAIKHPKPVPGVGGNYAVLYRHGTYEKHVATDQNDAAAQQRE